MKIDGYARISVDLQEDSHENTSIENQKRIIRDFVAKEFPDAELTIYEDRDRSGYTFSQRENYQKMRKELINGDVRILIVKDFSRFSRRNSLGLLELETLRDAGIRIISIGDNIDYPTRDDWMLIQFKFLMNEMPVTDTSKKIKQMIDNRQKNGQWICAVPYGYRITNTKEMTYEIDPPAAEVVREVFRLYNLGWGYKKIANHLTDSGVPTPRANEIAQKEAEGKATKLTARNEWSIITVQAILKNDFYIGTLRQRKYTRKGINGKDVKLGDEDNIVIENAHEPIVDGKTFAYTKEQLRLRSKGNYRGEKKYSTDYSGFMFCGDCGRLMAGECGTSGTNSVKYYYYKCGGAKRKLGCKRKAVKKRWIERAAVIATIERVLRDDEIDRIADAIIDLQNREDTTLPALRQQLKDCEQGIENMLNAIQMGILTPSTKTRLEELESRRESLKVSILQAELEKPKYTKEQIVSWINRFKYGNVDDIEYQRQIIDTFINAIYVFDDKLVFTYNFKDGTEAIPLKAVEDAFGSDLTQVAPPNPRNPNIIPIGDGFGFLLFIRKIEHTQ